MEAMVLVKLEALEQKYHEVEMQMSDPSLWEDHQRFTKVSREHAELKEFARRFKKYKELLQGKEENQALLHMEEDEEMRALCREEIVEQEAQMEEIEHDLRLILLPKDPNDERDVILEIRAGTGGDEAALFAEELFRMYLRYAEQMRWKVEVLSKSETGLGGFKEVVAQIQGNQVYSRLKYESGVHRVQRVPKTETQGRVHTSAVTVAVLPEAEEVDVQLEERDLKIDVYRSSGPGGQSVNTTDSAVRATHLPSGLVVICQDEKSQHKNKAKALKVLRSRLYEQKLAAQHAEESEMRRSQIGSGDRSEKIRTYNFPQNRVSDHRIQLTVYKLEEILNGTLDEVLKPLLAAMNAQALQDQC